MESNTPKYNIWFVICYEATSWLIDMDSKWELNPLVRKLREYCRPDWVEWKTETTMNDVDLQAKAIKERWAAEENGIYTKPIIIEHKPDGSKAQDLLGGELEIRAPYYEPKKTDT